MCNEFYINCGEKLRTSILKVINIEFEKGVTPKTWKKLMIKTIYKGKGNRIQ